MCYQYWYNNVVIIVMMMMLLSCLLLGECGGWDSERCRSVQLYTSQGAWVSTERRPWHTVWTWLILWRRAVCRWSRIPRTQSHSCWYERRSNLTCNNNNNEQHPFNGPLSGTTQVSQYQKAKTNLDFTEARDSEWQWHQLGHVFSGTSADSD